MVRGAVAALLLAVVAACGREQGDQKLIGFSQANLGEPWRVAMNAEIADAAAQHPELKVVYADAQQDNARQVADVESFLRQKVDLLIISPNEAKPLTPVVKRAFESGIPVIVLDREIEGDSYTTFIGADNRAIGKAAGDFVAELLGGTGRVVEIKGLPGSTRRATAATASARPSPRTRASPSSTTRWPTGCERRRWRRWSRRSRRTTASTSSMRTMTPWRWGRGSPRVPRDARGR